MTTQELDQAKAEAFSGQLVAIINGANLALMLSIGHRTRLFDTLAGLPPATSRQIADAAGLNERYVREWLGAMVTGRIVEYDQAAHSYRLPSEHAASLTRAAGPHNMARFMQTIAQLGPVEDAIVRCFREGGGVPYAAYPGFQRLMAEISNEVQDALLIDAVLPLVPGLRERLRAGCDAADVGCGMGHALNLLARAFPKSRFTGYDISSEGIASGREEAAGLGLTNARFVEQDVARLEAPAAFDLITAFDTIHDQARPDMVLKQIVTALRPGGVLLMVDVAASSELQENLDHPLGPGLYTISTLHCMTVSLAQGGMGLGAAWGEQKARQLLAEAGFGEVQVTRIEGDFMNSYYVARR